MRKNDVCINTTDAGSIWGNWSDWAEVNKVAKSGVEVKFLGNYMTWDDDNVYAVFCTEESNYFVKLKY
jgi:hypothetical protein